MKRQPTANVAPPRRIITAREVDRFIRFEVALIKQKRKKMGLGVEKCAGWVGLTPRGWRKVEHRRTSPTSKTLVRMKVAVNLTFEEVRAALEGRKMQHLRRATGAELLFLL